jgi:hypothetical protein
MPAQVTSRWWGLLVLCAALLVPAQPARAEFFAQQGGKLVGAGAVGTARQGLAVAVSGDGNTALVGGLLDSSSAGATWVFTRTGGAWTQQGGKLVGSGAVGAGHQGAAVALSADGNTAIVGGADDDDGVGAVWIFTRTGGSWTQQGNKLIGTGATGKARQGSSVALSDDGNTAIVGGFADNSQIGAVWIFTRSGGVWTQQGGKLVGTGSSGTPQQGASVAVSADGNTLITGGFTDNTNIGAAWVFTRSGTTWTQQGNKLAGTGAGTTPLQGQSVALSADGNTAAVGGVSDTSETGAVWVYTRSGSTWSQQGNKLVGTGAVGTANQGQSVALSADGNLLIVGGFADNTFAGATWAFTRSGSTWTQRGNKLVGTGASGTFSRQGFSVSLSDDGNTLIAGAWGDNSFAGAAWVFAQRKAHDFNGDGKSDLAWRHDSGLTSLWLMNGAVASSSALLGTVPLNWEIVGQRDFNGDSRHDLLWRDTASGQATIWFLQGTAVSSTALLGTVPLVWQVAGTGDFNGDGKGDVLWRNTSTGAVSVWLLNGATVSSTGILGTVALNWSIDAVADFNGDGKADLLWRDGTTGTTTIWFLNGTAVSSTALVGTIATTWQVAAAGDFNGDGKADLAWRDNTGNTALWLMNGAVVSSSAILGVVPAAWQIVETGDFNGDGKADLLWRNTSTGLVSLWLLDGTLVTSSVNVGTVSTDWTIENVNVD